MPSKSRLLALIVAAFCAVQPVASRAADELLETLAQKGVISMEDYEKLKAQRKAAPAVVTDDGFRIASGDGGWSVQVGVLQQLDLAAYKDDGIDLADGTEMRRSRLSLGGTFLKDWQYRVEYEFATGSSALTDAYVTYTAIKPVLVTLGQFKPPFGMEALSQDKSATFMERALPFYLVSPVVVRAPGAMLSTSGINWSVAGGVFGEPIGNAQSGDEGYGAAARASFAPLFTGSRIVHLGLSGQWRDPTQDNSSNATGQKFDTVRFRAKPESNILAQRFVDTGELADVKNYTFAGVEFAAQYDALSLQSEYQQVSVKRGAPTNLDFDTWYAQLAYTLTGEARPYRVDRGVFEGIKPAKNFARGGGWGAFEVAARISELDLTDGPVTGGRERNATAALSWYLNPFLRVSANYVKVLDVNGGAFDGEEPSVWQMRLQIAI